MCDCAHVCTVSTWAPGRCRRPPAAATGLLRGLTRIPFPFLRGFTHRKVREIGHLPCKIKTSGCLAWPTGLFPRAEALPGETSADLSVDRETRVVSCAFDVGALRGQPGHLFCAHFSGSGGKQAHAGQEAQLPAFLVEDMTREEERKKERGGGGGEEEGLQTWTGGEGTPMRFGEGKQGAWCKPTPAFLSRSHSHAG